MPIQPCEETMSGNAGNGRLGDSMPVQAANKISASADELKHVNRAGNT